jgi:hypothetical protein
MTTTAMMIPKSPSSPTANETSAAARMIYTSGLFTCARRMDQIEIPFSAGKRFSPDCLRCSKTSAYVNPLDDSNAGGNPEIGDAGMFVIRKKSPSENGIF